MLATSFGLEVSVLVASPGNCTRRLMTSTAYQSLSQSQSSPEHVATSFVIGCRVVVLQLNTEGISKAKTQVIEHLVSKSGATVILLQETHATNPNSLKIPGYSLAAHTSSRVHDMVTVMSSSLRWQAIASSSPTNDLEWTTTEVKGITITNVCKPPGTRLHPESLPRYPKPCIYAGDFTVAARLGATPVLTQMATSWKTGHPLQI